tara:strand:- start:194 stop:571 length:378 start_codon:yes stop_codon:yes gene_type:complete
MGEAIDIKLLLTIGAMIVSVVTSSVIVKQKLAAVIERLDALQKDYESRLRNLDQRTDKQENEIDLNAQKTAVLSSILSPSQLEKQHRETEKTIGSVAAVAEKAESNQRRILKLESMHNGSHPKIV